MIIEHVSKAISLLLEDGEKAYIGLNSIPAILGAFLARDVYNRKIRILGVAEADNPKSVSISPSTGNPFYSEEAPVMITADSFDLFQKGLLDVMFLGPVQIDEETNVNLSVIGSYEKPKVRLTGGAATAYLMPLAKKVILWNLKHSKRSLVKKVDFVTGTAKYSNNNVFLVTNLGVMRYEREWKKWIVTHVYPWSNCNVIRENTDFDTICENVGKIEVTQEDLNFINKLDPYNLRSALEGF
ncbi:CoA-transferase subunit beta [Sulfolobus sp. S-194]|uniref:CoA-transferase subunit beta n=1 Tax=Sulfolobus sp. S-194 TaxID=2512240 RepID=UPI001436EB43|nr:CoA-transferase [Sulfolobus sp. S-194]QIW23681.1 CoA-transferase subunit beta [Sulfolobus sp. S-194]